MKSEKDMMGEYWFCLIKLGKKGKLVWREIRQNRHTHTQFILAIHEYNYYRGMIAFLVYKTNLSLCLNFLILLFVDFIGYL